MPRGREPTGERPLSNAERQARYRARHRDLAACAAPAGSTRARKAEPRSSRPSRWHAAVTELLALQTEYVTWLDSLPDSLQVTPTAEALQAIADLDLDALASIEPPRGYGRD